jgi:hypothetical protein
LVAQLRNEVDRLQNELHAHPAAASGAVIPGAATPGGAPTPAPAPAGRPAAEDPAPPAGAMFAAGSDTRPREVWPWTLGAALLGLAVGFAVGLLVLDRHIRRKYGGLRIY